MTSFSIYFSIFNYSALSKGRVLMKCITGIIGGMKTAFIPVTCVIIVL